MQDDKLPLADPPTDTRQSGDAAPAHRDLPPAARRALAEAEARRRVAKAEKQPAETGGRKGPEPVRYGDWEKNGIISDF